jgi:hypothetical protein
LEAAFTYRLKKVTKKSNVECCMLNVELLNC